jgi:hypothetical protein
MAVGEWLDRPPVGRRGASESGPVHRSSPEFRRPRFLADCRRSQPRPRRASSTARRAALVPARPDLRQKTKTAGPDELSDRPAAAFPHVIRVIAPRPFHPLRLLPFGRARLRSSSSFPGLAPDGVSPSVALVPTTILRNVRHLSIIDHNSASDPNGKVTRTRTGACHEPQRPSKGIAGSAGLLRRFVDGQRTIKRWTDPKAFDHRQLLQILRASGSSPRVEHLAFSDFPARWDRAAAAGRLPDLIASEKLPASARELERRGRLLGVVSQRLAWMPGLASCPDFAGRSLHMLQGGPHESAARRAVGELVKPGPETDPPGPRLPDAADAVGAEHTARRAVAAYMMGDPRAL